MEDGWVADPDYEFSAPHYFDFVRGETEEEAQDAQNWFHTAATYPASPYVAKIKERETLSDETKESLDEVKGVGHEHPDTNMDISALNFDDPTSNQGQDMTEDMEICTPRGQVNTILGQETVKRVPPFSSKSTLTKPTASHLAKRIDSSVRGRREVKSMKQVKGRCTPTVLVNKEKVAEKSAAEENQAVKRQKLDGGRLRQIHNVKEQVLPHKVSSALKDLSASKEKIVRAHNERGFTASSKGESADGVSRPVQLKLTVPKEPALVTAQRSRPVRVKSTAELEEELLAKMQKFKARPLNKKILEASSLPLPPKSVPQLPVFQEFNLKTSERAMQHCAATSSISSSTDSVGITEKHHLKSALGGGLTEPRMPHLETALRARPPKVKSSEELQKEELENFPKFKARPLNKKIFSSRGDLGVFRHFKRQVTKPEEFHFSTDERCHSSPAPADLFMKLSLNSEPSHDAIVRQTKPKPFHLLTEERGAEKERKLMLELQEQENKEHEARIPKANPLPYTIDFPVIPPKPEPKECTKPEPFQLESLVRHEEELQRMVEERARAERKEAEIRKFRAQPIKSNVPVHIPEVPRMPLTEVQEFTFHVDARAVERMEFDKKVLEKQNMYKRYREEYEAAKKADEERDIKIMRKAMVPHARPMPHFTKPFVPERSSKDLTEPKSPKFCALQHKYDGWLSTLTTQKR